ncbi:hypothetical protein NDI45_20400 [Leptolyngbya sp. GB1-A1]|uniref:hypothetical protein n=1 Tax=Leptolyngbya sp. GB1-A1 TaxID=2933908 RepID=UPI0032995979
MTTPSNLPLQPRHSECPHCSGNYLKFDEAFRYYSCGECGHIWAHDPNAPAWEDYVDDEELLKQVYDSDPEYWAKLIERRLD